MRALRLILAATLAILALAAPLVGPASAQVVVGPQRLLDYTAASVTAVNTTGAVTLYSYQIPPGFVATGTRGNAVVAGPPLHLGLVGLLTTNQGVGAAGAINIGVNYGGSTATIALANARVLDGSMTNVPVTIDVWLSPIATPANINATPTGQNTVLLTGQIAYASNLGASTVVGIPANFATVTSLNAGVIGSTKLNVAQTLSVIWQWASGSNSNSFSVYRGTLRQGD